ncbi:MAG: C39 family peptidase [Clostridia bacterium]|nr:C39 family peptidase [Clostridia bacterium]
MFSYHTKNSACSIVLAVCLFILAFVSSVTLQQPVIPAEEPLPPAAEGPSTTAEFKIPQALLLVQDETHNAETIDRTILFPYGEPRSETAEEHILQVPFMDQSAYPTGCESVSTVMLLQYYDIDMDVDTFIDNYLETHDYYTIGSTLYAVHPADAFIGDPRSNTGFGCYSPVIYRALGKCLPESFEVEDVSGQSLEDLCHRYIDLGHPVLVWATMHMWATSNGFSWHIPGSSETFTWLNNEHCLVLVGYDSEYYYFNDPLSSSAPTAYARELVERRYAELGMQALVVHP